MASPVQHLSKTKTNPLSGTDTPGVVRATKAISDPYTTEVDSTENEPLPAIPDLKGISDDAAVAVAARCALRVLPLVRPGALRTEQTRLTGQIQALTVTIEGVIAWLLTHRELAEDATRQAHHPILVAVAQSADTLSEIARNQPPSEQRAILCAIYLARSVISRSRTLRNHARDAMTAAHSAARAFRGQAGEMIVRAMEADMRLLAPQPGSDESAKTDSRTSAETAGIRLIKNAPLWPEGAPERWQSAILGPWRKEMNQLAAGSGASSLADIAEQHSQLATGRRLDSRALLHRVSAWSANAPNGATASRFGAPTAREDTPTRQDHLGRTTLVESLSAMLAAREQTTPFTLALLGNWGSGKSSVFEQIKVRLQDYENGQTTPFRFRHATFNAWQYEHTDNIRAGLAQEVIDGILEGQGRWWRRLQLKLQFARKEHMGAIRSGVTWLVLALVIVASLIALPKLFEDWLGGTGSEILRGTAVLGFIGTIIVLVKESKKLLDHPLSVELATYLKLPDYGDHLGVIPVMKRHIATLCELCGIGAIPEKNADCARLVVFIDDLDRCEPTCILDTFDAVRLVMDIPGVIVIIAIDHRIALRAVARHYESVAVRNDEAEEIARDYLGKIVQLSVLLEDPTPESLDDFVRRRLFQSVRDDEDDAADTAGQDRVEPGTGASESTKGSYRSRGSDAFNHSNDDSLNREDQASSAPSYTADREQLINGGESEQGRRTTGLAPDVSRARRIAHMADTRGARDAFAQAVRDFSFRNPRQIIRLHNTLRLLTQVNLAPNGQPLRDEAKLRHMLFWLEYLNQRSAAERSVLEDALRKFEPEDHTRADRNALVTVQAAFPAVGDTDHHHNDYDSYRRFVGHFVLPSIAGPSASSSHTTRQPAGIS